MSVEGTKEETKKTESAVDAKKNVGEQFSACIVVTLIALTTIVGLSVALALRVRDLARCEAQVYPPVPGSDIVVFWYKPHYQVRLFIFICVVVWKFEFKAAAYFWFCIATFPASSYHSNNRIDNSLFLIC